MTAFEKFRDGVQTFASDVAQGFFEITHNGLALVGVLVVFAVAALAFKPDLRVSGEAQLIAWLQARQFDAMKMFEELKQKDRGDEIKAFSEMIKGGEAGGGMAPGMAEAVLRERKTPNRAGLQIGDAVQQGDKTKYYIGGGMFSDTKPDWMQAQPSSK